MTDVVVIGGGIAGVTAAAHLSPHLDVVLLEKEPTLSYHTTGRSAAMSIVSYHTKGVRPLSKASRVFLGDPPAGSVDAPLLTPRDILWVAGANDVGDLESQLSETSERLDVAQTLDVMPVMNPDWLAGGLIDRDSQEIDVAGLHQAFVRIARKYGADIVTSSPVTSITREGGGWSVATSERSYECDIVVDAAGAWGDQVAALAGVEAIGLTPMRRTAFMVPGRPEYSGLPMVVEVGEKFYFKPDGVQMLCSLAEEVPSEPTDAKPRMEDVALAIERINEATTLQIRTVNSEWTGLRTFTPDLDMAIGEERGAPGFYWLVGQGGIGIQTAPAYGSMLASLVLDTALSDDLTAVGADPTAFDPARFRAHR